MLHPKIISTLVVLSQIHSACTCQSLSEGYENQVVSYSHGSRFQIPLNSIKKGLALATASLLMPVTDAACNLGNVTLDYSSVSLNDDTCSIKSSANPLIGISTASLAVAAMGLIYSSRPDGLIGKAWKRYVDPQLEKWEDHTIKSVLLKEDYNSFWDRIRYLNFAKTKDFPKEILKKIKIIKREFEKAEWVYDNVFDSAHQNIGFSFSNPILKVSFEKVHFNTDRTQQSMTSVESKDKIDEYVTFIQPYEGDKFNILPKVIYDSFFELVGSKHSRVQISEANPELLAINFNAGLKIFFHNSFDYNYGEKRPY